MTASSFLSKESIISSFKKRKEKKNTQSPPYNIQDPLLLYLYHPLPASTYHCPPTQTKLALSTLDCLLFPRKDVHLHISDPLLLIPLSPYHRMPRPTGISFVKPSQMPSDRIHYSLLCSPITSGL